MSTDRAYLAPLAEGEVLAQVERAIRESHPARAWRTRRLPPMVTFWFVLGMALWRRLSQPEVFKNLQAAWRCLGAVSDGALAKARLRLGAQPLRRFFEWTAQRGHPEPTFHGLRVFALDGVRASVPDSRSNAKAYGRPESEGPGRPFPQALLLLLCAVMTRSVRAVSIEPCHSGERRPGLPLLDLLGAGDLLLLDTGFYAAWMIEELNRRKISFIVRLPASVKNFEGIDPSKGWFQIQTRYRREVRGGRRVGPSRTIRIQGRIVSYRHRRSRVRLITNLRRLRDLEIIRAYHLRWEIELCNDELKTHLATPAQGTPPLPLRSKSPALIEQEIYALLALYNLLRAQITRAAKKAGVSPLRMSFVSCLCAIQRACVLPVPRRPQEIKGRWLRLLEDLKACVLDRSRRPRQAPRAVRPRSHSFPTKRARQRTRAFAFFKGLRIANPGRP